MVGDNTVRPGGHRTLTGEAEPRADVGVEKIMAVLVQLDDEDRELVLKLARKLARLENFHRIG